MSGLRVLSNGFKVEEIVTIIGVDMPQVPTYSAGDCSAAVQGHYLPRERESDITVRIQYHMKALLGCPYMLGACGEGPLGEYDQKPFCRADGADCLTFVNLVLALSFASCVEEIESTLKQLNYYSGVVSYHTRFHWMSLDWLPENERLGFIHPLSLKGNFRKQEVKKEIAQREWFMQKSVDDLHYIDRQAPLFLENQLELLHRKSDCFATQLASVSYYAISDLYSNWNTLVDTLSEIDVMVVVRPAMDASNQCLALVSHVGFSIKKNGELLFVHAKQDECVCEESLKNYLKKHMKNEKILGVMFYGIN